MNQPKATFAVPGDLDALTGGYIYEKQVLLGLRRAGWDMAHLPLPGSFPTPTPNDVETTARALAALPPNRPVLLDGFLTGAMPPDRFSALRAPFVAITHHPLAYETGLDPERAAYLHAVERANLARAARVVVPSPHTANVLAADFGVPRERIIVAPPGAAKPEFGAADRVQPPEILCVGQLLPRKGQDVLLGALAQLRDLTWSAQIVGAPVDADFTAKLQEKVQTAGLARRVHFPGMVSPERLMAFYARASVFALPTRYEGYGMVFAEALSFGLPIVSCAAGAVPDTVPRDAGILVPPDDDAAFAGALRRLLTDEHHAAKLSAAALQHGKALPSWDDTARIVAGVLAEIA